MQINEDLTMSINYIACVYENEIEDNHYYVKDIDQNDFERIYQEYLDSEKPFKDDGDITKIINSSNQ
jgi:hypothetical protein